MIPPRDGNATRIEAFSDAMIGFAATLLVVSLDPPRTFDDLIVNLWGFIPFGLSFTGLYFIWVVHTKLFRRYPLTDGWSILLNGVLLFTVLFYVYPLKFMASSFVARLTGVRGAAVSSWAQLQSLFIIYDLGWIVVFILFALLYWRAYRTRAQLGLTAIEAYDALTYSRALHRLRRRRTRFTCNCLLRIRTRLRTRGPRVLDDRILCVAQRRAARTGPSSTRSC